MQNPAGGHHHRLFALGGYRGSEQTHPHALEPGLSPSLSLPPSLPLSPFSLSSLSPLSLGTCIPRYLQMDAMMSHVCMQMDADLKQVVDVMKEYFENLGGDAQGV